MVTPITLRASKGAPLSWAEADNNFLALGTNTDANAAAIVTANAAIAAITVGNAPSIETFVAGIGFTPGVTTALTLARSYGSISNIIVHFDGIFQGPDQIASIVNNTLAFNAAIPVGVNNVYIKGGVAQSVGVPSLQSVGVPQLGTDTVAYIGTAGCTTANRPTPTRIGHPEFDKTLGQPIWASQISPPIWVNSAGVQV